VRYKNPGIQQEPPGNRVSHDDPRNKESYDHRKDRRRTAKNKRVDQDPFDVGPLRNFPILPKGKKVQSLPRRRPVTGEKGSPQKDQQGKRGAKNKIKEKKPECWVAPLSQLNPTRLRRLAAYRDVLLSLGLLYDEVKVGIRKSDGDYDKRRRESGREAPFDGRAIKS